MSADEQPVLDDHLHLAPERGRGLDAVRDFARSGGTHLLIVNQPSWKHGVAVDEAADFDSVFEATIDVAERASEGLPGRAWAVLGVHPGLISRLVDRGYTTDDAAALMRAGLERAAEYVADEPDDAATALALKSGRPHYDVDDAVWDASNAVLRRGIELAAETGCAIQLHTESTADLTDVGAWAEEAGLDPARVVKHYAEGPVAGVTPSVMADRDFLSAAVESADPFLVETDFLDDPDRPGAVRGPKTVPRRTAWLQDEGRDEAARLAHVETPQRVYGIDTRGTLGK